MASQVGKDGRYRMIVEDKYKKLAKTRNDAKIFAILTGFYGVLKLSLASVPSLFYGEAIDPLYVASIVAIFFAFAIFAVGSGGGKAHLERGYLLWLFVFLAAIVGSKVLLDAFNNPLIRAAMDMPSPEIAQPYDTSVAKLLVQKLNIEPKDAVYDVDIINLFLDGFGSFCLLAASAATFKFQRLKAQPKTSKKTA